MLRCDQRVGTTVLSDPGGTLRAAVRQPTGYTFCDENYIDYCESQRGERELRN